MSAHIRIGLVSTWLARGASYVTKQYANSLKLQGADVYIYARGGEYYDTSPVAYPVTFAPRLRKGRPSWAFFPKFHFKDWITKNKLDIVFFNEQKWLEPIMWCHDWKILNGAYIDYYTETLLPILGLHDFVICNTKRHLSAFEWHPSSFYIPWGTDTSVFLPVEKADPRYITLFHSVGMSPYRKGTDLLLNALSKIKNKSIKTIIHTQVDITKYYPQLSSIISALTEKGKLEIITDTVGPPGLYGLGDIYVYPSRLDGIGLSLPEAISSGLIPIAPDFPPMNEFFNDSFGVAVKIKRLWSRSDGYYWPQNELDTDSMVEHIENLTSDIEVLNKRKILARKYALSYLDWNINSSKILDHFTHATFRNDKIKHTAYMLAQKYNLEKHVNLKKILYLVGKS